MDSERRVSCRSLVDWASDKVGRSGIAAIYVRLLPDNAVGMEGMYRCNLTRCPMRISLEASGKAHIRAVLYAMTEYLVFAEAPRKHTCWGRM